MLKWIKEQIFPLRIQDHQFGNIRFLRDARFWEGKIYLSKVGMEIEVLIDGNEKGPTEAQRSFFSTFEMNYELRWSEIKKALIFEARHRELANDIRFILKCISIPEKVEDNEVWKLYYETQPKEWHFIVTMKHWEPCNITVEC